MMYNEKRILNIKTASKTLSDIKPAATFEKMTIRPINIIFGSI